ncbi:MAG TPA: ABC transporter substrate-binding protein [Thermomicrobiales bacterium]
MAKDDGLKLSRRNLVKAGAAMAAVGPFIGKGAGVAAQDLPDVPRNRTLILRWQQPNVYAQDWNLWNGYPNAANHQNGLGLLHEPLAFYSAFADKTYPWLAESWEYNADFTQLNIKTRAGIKWSDGTPFTAEDVAFTIMSVKQFNTKIKWGANVEPFVDTATATSDTEVEIKFKVPSPRFMYFMTYKYDIGLYIVPKHIFDGQDFASFLNFDLDKGLPVTTGPWKVVFASPEQKVIDRRDSWWAVDQGLVPALPEVQRVIYLPFSTEQDVAEALIKNDADCSLDLRPLTISTVLDQNPNITTHTGKEKPYGYVDWWPTSLYVNCEKPPFDDPAVRWALSYFIDRQQVIDVAYDGAGSISSLPMPTYPGLQPFAEGVADLLQQYPTTEFNPDKGAKMLTDAGWTKDGGNWTKNGEKLSVPIEAFVVMDDIGPVIVQQLKNQGIDSAYSDPPDFFDRFPNTANWTASLFGHGGSVSGDPYFTLALYQSTSEAVPGGHQVNASRWKNADYDKIVDEMASTPIDDKDKLMDEWHRAMALFLPALPDIQIQEWYHRIPMNQTYWKGWPTKDNSFVNGAFWHLTFQLILNELKAAQ